MAEVRYRTPDIGEFLHLVHPTFARKMITQSNCQVEK
jgi:hypothetical protein